VGGRGCRGRAGAWGGTAHLLGLSASKVGVGEGVGLRVVGAYGLSGVRVWRPHGGVCGRVGDGGAGAVRERGEGVAVPRGGVRKCSARGSVPSTVPRLALRNPPGMGWCGYAGADVTDDVRGGPCRAARGGGMTWQVLTWRATWRRWRGLLGWSGQWRRRGACQTVLLPHPLPSTPLPLLPSPHSLLSLPSPSRPFSSP